MSDNVSVASGAKKPSDSSSGVTVIDTEPFSLSVSSTADEAVTRLVLIYLPIFFFCDSVGFPDTL